jgi:hypothetical protein
MLKYLDLLSLLGAAPARSFPESLAPGNSRVVLYSAEGPARPVALSAYVVLMERNISPLFHVEAKWNTEDELQVRCQPGKVTEQHLQKSAARQFTIHSRPLS